MTKLDKRTKEYKRSKGLGDTIEKITEATGIKTAVKFIFGEDCGCDERKKKLNEWFPYVNCLNENEFNYLKEWFSIKRNKVQSHEQKELLLIYNRVFNKKQKETSCVSCLVNIMNNLETVYKEYLTK